MMTNGTDTENRRRDILGFRVDDWTMPELVAALDRAIVARTPVHVYGLSVPFFALARSTPQVVSFTQEFDIVTADGAGIPLFARLLGLSVRGHVGLPHLAEQMIILAAEKGYRLMLLGGTSEANGEACRRLLARFPNLKLCPGIDGYYSQEQEADVARQVRDARPDVLLVGMSLPKKERFLLRWKDYMDVPVGIACGGYLDVLAGKTRLAPKIMEKLAMSWFYRFLQEPRRLFSTMIVGAGLFLFYVLPFAVFNRVFSPGRKITIFDLFPSRH